MAESTIILLAGARTKRASQRAADRLIDRVVKTSEFARARGYKNPLVWYATEDHWARDAAAVIAAAIAGGVAPPSGWSPREGEDLPAATVLGRPTLYVGDDNVSSIAQRLRGAARAAGVRGNVPYITRLAVPIDAGTALVLSRAALRRVRAGAPIEARDDLSVAAYRAGYAAPRGSPIETVWVALERALHTVAGG